MKIRIGVIGPKDSVNQIMKTGAQMEELELIPFFYENIEETQGIILNNQDRIDQWFFSGQAPYYYALAKGYMTKEAGSYIPLNGSSLLSTLLESFVKEGKIIYRFSLDSIQQDEMEKACGFFNHQDFTIYTNPYHGYMPAEKMIEFHKELYEKGQTDVAITCLNAVYTKLKELGIPAFRVAHSELAIQRGLDFLIARGRASWYRQSQLVILGVEVIYPSAVQEGYNMPFKLKHQELDLMRILLHFVEEINGSLAKMGNGLFFIYTTRGDLDYLQKQRELQALIDEIRINSELPVRIGIGYGYTVLEAEQHVRIAFEQVRTYNEPVIIAVNENKEITEVIGQNKQLTFQTRNLGTRWEELFKDANISSAHVMKIKSFAHHHRQTDITAQELARWLKSTERNARRILSEMEQIGLANVIGEESTGRGRPRKVYELQFHRLD
ncbi:hypothetical protein F7731_09830 [Cytobacillus depressus]|uniref:Transcriptional regulator n=1 Tax=Cytobacillus depressus TaxID=1602942 RepID=A0A6L3V888_9BACI|nr:hypothetical protein [Cytobacillus depressus]KAB2336651.1 hypothetical protein F7731_09830 [Cytobacillus depressus]